MNKINFLFLFVFLISLSIEDEDKQDKDRDYLGIIFKIFPVLEQKCYPHLQKILDERQMEEKNKSYPWISDAIGKGLNDIGDESECMSSIPGTIFIMSNIYNIKLTKLFQKSDFDLLDFLEIKNYTIGICLMKECKDTFYRYANILIGFLNFLENNQTGNASEHISFIENDKNDTSSKYNVNKEGIFDTSGIKEAILYILLAFVGLKLIGGLIRIIAIPKGYDKYIGEKLNKERSLSSSGNDIDEQSNLSKKRKFSETLTNDAGYREYNPLFDFTDKLPWHIKLLKMFDIWNDLYYLSSIRNKFFNDTGLDVINFNRAIIIGALVFNKTFTTLISLPSAEIFNITFFKNWLNIFYRLSNNAFVCWIFLEGVYTTYKLLCFITSQMFKYYAKNGRDNTNLNLKLFIIYGKFLLLLIPKIVMFFAIYYIFYYRVEDFASLSDEKATVSHVIRNIFKQNIECENITSIFKFDFSREYKSYNCYEFTHFYFNMAASILFSMIIIYLFFLVKNFIFELALILINIIYFCIMSGLVIDPKVQNNDVDDKTKFLQYHIDGQNYTTKILHLFVCVYVLGLFIGFILFNYDGIKSKINKLIYENYSTYFSRSSIKDNDKISEDKTSLSFSDLSSENLDSGDNLLTGATNNNYTNFQLPYYPFIKLNNILIWLKKRSFLTKIILIIVCIILFFIIDMPFLLLLNGSENFKIGLNDSYVFLFRYEKHLFLLVYIFLNIIMITLPKKGILRNIMNSRIVITISRFGFLLTCFIYFLSYFSFLIFYLRVKLYVPTFMIIAFGDFLIFALVCIFINSITELPMSILIKRLLRLGTKKGNNNIQVNK